MTYFEVISTILDMGLLICAFGLSMSALVKITGQKDQTTMISHAVMAMLILQWVHV